MAKFANLNISAQSKTLSETCTYTTAELPVLGADVNLDGYGDIVQLFNFSVDKFSLRKETGLYDVSATDGLEDKLNSDISISDLASSSTASDYFGALFDGAGIEANSVFDDFKPTGIKVKDSTTKKWVCNETYASALQKIFGWTSIIPTRVINVFRRGSGLTALQRGKEYNDDIDVTGYCDEVVYEYSKMNLLFSSSKAYYLTGDNSDTKSDDSTDTSDPNTYLSGQFTDDNNQQTLNYRYGLLTSESFLSTDGTINSTTTYTYSAIYPPANMLSKVLTRTENPNTTVPDPSTITSFPYKVVTKIVNSSSLTNTMAENGSDLVGSTEEIQTTTTGYNITDKSGTTVAFTDEETHSSSTIYSDMGQGQWSVTTYKDTKLTGSQVVTGNPGAKASPYSIKTNSTMASRKGKHVKTARTKLSGKFAGSMNINVSDQDTISSVAADIESLNGKTQERVTLVYHGSKFIDYTSKIVYNGNKYYLDGNNITIDPDNGTKQALVLLRWY